MYSKSILNKIAKISFYNYFYFEIAVKWSKSRIFEKFQFFKNLRLTPSKMHMYDIVKIDSIVFEIVGGLLKPPPPDDPDR